MDYIIDTAYAGKTIKDFLKNRVKPSHRLLSMLKNRDDGIMINNIRVTVRYVLSEGDLLSLNYSDYSNRDADNIVPNDSLMKLVKIIYEDEYIAALNKPYGMPSHPSINHFDDTLANAVVSYFRSKNQNINFRSANRLDRNTSGIVLIAKDKLTSARLNALIKSGDIKKTYNAVAAGNIDSCNEDMISEDIKNIGGVFHYDRGRKTGEIAIPIKREKESIIKRVCAADGDYAETEFKVLQTGSDEKLTYLEIYPKTGRTHQIRVHFHRIGYPLVGDDLYFVGESFENGMIKRHALHASKLEFVHPITGKYIVITCDLCEDMKILVSSLGKEILKR